MGMGPMGGMMGKGAGKSRPKLSYLDLLEVLFSIPGRPHLPGPCQ